mmetsp:Transcript_19021/g.29691  ORF Transcript_19021/g.29691 Transcript_19021/m.29691 type:complete len:388 (-) Transcript_19021:148-1311(-)
MGLWKLALALSSLATAAIYVCWQQIEDQLAIAMAKAMSKKIGAHVTIGSLLIRKTRFGAKNITISNGPYPHDGCWKSPHFAFVEEMEMTTPGLLGSLSLPGPLRMGSFMVGFDFRDISTIAVRGVRIFVEEVRVEGKTIANNEFLKVFEDEEKQKKLKAAEEEVASVKAWRKKWEGNESLIEGEEDSEAAEASEGSEDQEMDLTIMGRYKMAMDVIRRTQGQSLSERAAAISEHRGKVVSELARKKDINRQVKVGKVAKDDEPIRVGKVTIEDCEVKMLGHKMILEETFVIRAYSGTVGGLKKKVGSGVLAKALSDTVGHQKERMAEKATVFKEVSREKVETQKEKLKQRAAVITEAGKEKVGEVKQMVKEKAAAAAQKVLGFKPKP